MTILLLALAFLGLAALIAGWWGNRRRSKREGLREMEEDAPPTPVTERPEGCCGQHAVCEKDSLLAAVQREIEYFDDEELDAFRGRPSDNYTPDEAEAFREVLYTMRQDEVAGWVRSLTLRGVNLPDELKDEVILLVGSLRGNGQ